MYRLAEPNKIGKYDIVTYIGFGSKQIFLCKEKQDYILVDGKRCEPIEPGMICEQQYADVLGISEYTNYEYSENYKELITKFVHRCKTEIDGVQLRRKTNGMEYLTLSDENTSWTYHYKKNRFLIINPKNLPLDRRTAEYQIIYAQRGRGLTDNDAEIYGVYAMSGEPVCVNESNLYRSVLKFQTLPKHIRRKLRLLKIKDADGNLKPCHPVTTPFWDIFMGLFGAVSLFFIYLVLIIMLVVHPLKLAVCYSIVSAAFFSMFTLIAYKKTR